MITPISNFLFVLNRQLTDPQKTMLAQQIEVLNALFLTEYELIVVPKNPDREHRTTLYEDPVIALLSPSEIQAEDLCDAGFSHNLITEYGTDFCKETGKFEVPIDLESFFNNHKTTILFMEYNL